MNSRPTWLPSRGGWLPFMTVFVSMSVGLLATPARAGLFVSLVQVPPVPTEYDVGVPQSLEMLLKVTGNLAAPVNVSAFSVVMTWEPPAGVLATTLQTVDAAGTPSVDGNETTIVTGAGYFFNGKSPVAFMSDVAFGIDPVTQRYLSIDATPTLIAAGSVDLTIARIRFAVGPLGPAWGNPFQYNLQLDGDSEFYGTGFVVSPSAETLPVGNGGGTILAVPEPSTVGMLVSGVGLLGGIVIRRRATRCSVRKTAA